MGGSRARWPLWPDSPPLTMYTIPNTEHTFGAVLLFIHPERRVRLSAPQRRLVDGSVSPQDVAGPVCGHVGPGTVAWAAPTIAAAAVQDGLVVVPGRV